MNYVDTINGYDIYELTRETAKANGYVYPCFMAISEGNPADVFMDENSDETFEAVADWCERN